MSANDPGEKVVIISRIFRQLAAELRRRKVLRVVTVYAFTAWLILQIGETVFEPLGFEPWVMRATVIAAIAGFPIAFILAWIIDIRPEGLIFDVPLWGSDSDQPRAQKSTDVIFALLVLALVSGGTWYLVDTFLPDLDLEQTVQTTDAAPNSIAVLPFETFGTESDASYIAAGLAEEILNLLAAIEELKVASRRSSFVFQGQALDIREIADTLSVLHVLEGSARVADNRIRVSARLADGNKGHYTFSNSYERPLDDVFAIQQEIAQAVVSELRLPLSIEDSDTLKKKATENTDAYVLYLQARGRLRSSLDADVMRDASELFNQALALDEKFARAWAGLCEAQLRLFEITDSEEVFAIAKSACEKAQASGGDANIEMNIALGKLYRARGWLEPAEQEIAKALEMEPDAVDALVELVEIRYENQDSQGAEAVAHEAVKRAPDYWRAHEALASVYFRESQYDKAIRSYAAAIELAPTVASLHSAKGGAYWMLGDKENARAGYEESLRLKPTALGYTNIGLRYFYEGDFQQAADMQIQALKLAADNHEIWGRLAEAYRFLPNSKSAANEAYERAAKLAEEAVEVNPLDWYSIGLLGFYYAHLERYEGALSNTQLAVEISKGNPDALYVRALTLLRAGDQNGAIDALRQTVAADAYFIQFLDSEPDLQVLQGTERFEALKILGDDD